MSLDLTHGLTPPSCLGFFIILPVFSCPSSRSVAQRLPRTPSANGPQQRRSSWSSPACYERDCCSERPPHFGGRRPASRSARAPSFSPGPPRLPAARAKVSQQHLLLKVVELWHRRLLNAFGSRNMSLAQLLPATFAPRRGWRK